MKTATFVLAASLLFVPASFADSIVTYTAALGNFENPPTGSLATGLALIVVDTLANTIQIDVTFSGLTGFSTAAHIHCCVAQGGNAGVATTATSFPGFPLGVTSGTSDLVFDLTSSTIWNPAFVTASGGTTEDAEAALLVGLADNQAYLDIHTSAFVNGEIRGFLAALPAPVPEPRAWVLLLPVMLAVAIVKRSRRTDGLDDPATRMRS